MAWRFRAPPGRGLHRDSREGSSFTKRREAAAPAPQSGATPALNAAATPYAGMDLGHAQPVAADLTVSVIVPTFNRRSRLERLLLAIDRLPESRARLEVVVTVDGATDGTTEMLRGLRVGYPLRVIEQPNSGPAAARNAAIAAATGDVLLFLDDDVIPTESVIREHLLCHSRDA